jgi:hypothetical protein
MELAVNISVRDYMKRRTAGMPAHRLMYNFQERFSYLEKKQRVEII